jgi:hypothetical protein
MLPEMAPTRLADPLCSCAQLWCTGQGVESSYQTVPVLSPFSFSLFSPWSGFKARACVLP